MDEVIDCHVNRVANGGHQLVFVVKGSSRVVGEMQIAADERYLKVIAQQFSSWVGGRRDRFPGSVLAAPH